MATWIYERFRVSTVRACRLARLQRASWYYRSRARDQSALRMRIRDIAQARPRFGYQRIHIRLRREGWHVNRKRIHRLYRLDGLQVRMRVRRRKRMSLHRGPVPHAAARNQHWSMDFVHDQLLDGRRFRVLTRDRSVESRECVSRAGFCNERPERGAAPRRGCAQAAVA